MISVTAGAARLFEDEASQRIAHAYLGFGGAFGSTSNARGGETANAISHAVARLRLDRDLHVLVKRSQDAHQPLAFLILGSTGVISILLSYTEENYPFKVRGGATGWVAGCSKVGGLIAQARSVLALVPALNIAGWRCRRRCRWR